MKSLSTKTGSVPLVADTKVGYIVALVEEAMTLTPVEGGTPTQMGYDKEDGRGKRLANMGHSKKYI